MSTDRPITHREQVEAEIAAKADYIRKALGTSCPALRAENDRRAEERDRAYREQYDLPPARWEEPEEPVRFTRATRIEKLGLHHFEDAA